MTAPLTVETAARLLDAVRADLGRVLIGQEAVVEGVLTGLLAGGHVLLEGTPGLGKTLAVKTLAQLTHLSCARVQFTPDLMPADITGGGVLVRDPSGGAQVQFRPGPVFTHILIADEINRGTPKTQSALLEAMAEGTVTIGGEGRPLEPPFVVFATQNPIEMEGTYPLPEAQLDRFLFKLEVRANDAATLEQIVLHREIGVEPQVAQVLSRENLASLLELVRRVFMPVPDANFIARLVHATQPGQPHAGGIHYGASPRAALALAAASKARALIEGRLNASYEDVRHAAPHVLRHRLLLDYRAKLEGLTPDLLIARLLEHTPAQDAPLPTSLKAAKH